MHRRCGAVKEGGGVAGRSHGSGRCLERVLSTGTRSRVEHRRCASFCAMQSPPRTYAFRFGWANERRVPATLLIEPWSEDYTAPPGARLELVVRAASPDLWFNVISHEDGTAQVYVEGEATRLAYLGHNQQSFALGRRSSIQSSSCTRRARRMTSIHEILYAPLLSNRDDHRIASICFSDDRCRASSGLDDPDH